MLPNNKHWYAIAGTERLKFSAIGEIKNGFLLLIRRKINIKCDQIYDATIRLVCFKNSLGEHMSQDGHWLQ